MEARIADVRSWVEEHDPTLYRSAAFQVEEVRDSGNGIPGSYAIKGLASVYNKWSLDLGGFRERILPGAFDRVLGEDPHVLHTWDHDTSKTLSSTRSKVFPLELRSSKEGLPFYSRVAPTTYSADLRILMEGDVINQSSFAFTVEDAEWRFLEDEDMVERDIKEVAGLFDVTTCAMGAYPQTESEIAVRSLMARRATAVFFPNTGTISGTATTAGTATGAVWVPAQDFSTRSSGAEGNAEPPAENLAPTEEVPAAEDAAQTEGDQTPADQPAEQTPAEREAKEREHEKWRLKLLSDHRRTREFVFGVSPSDKEEAQ